ncbi:KUP/HAK/KT family potassium transporter [Parabacteroides sp. Marseille-P3160]|uniref:KUP/HAK/KT family potassium transporter n=1 Tax=Parabacteroides sp. Marseille-P3160 TaxID=1917887 RepID=UPI0009BC2337|nr:KUP/HAK/KT family potassium transporter [Parabacteroides sp. Marseille-P3160]
MNTKKHNIPFNALGVILAIGIVFGDIGTSPLYVMRAVLKDLPVGASYQPDYILGAVSCVIWTLTLQTTIKYVLITLRADNKGEGGILSLFALIRRNYRWAYIIAAFGAATLLADGVITPAMTVLSAIEGLHSAVPSVSVVPVTITIILILFLIQPFGTGSLGKYFGPVMVCWFLMIGLLGISQFIFRLDVFKAFNPMYAFHFLQEAPDVLVILGAIFLCTTGAEALYSDLGHCGLKNIRISWFMVKTMLIFNYLGQAAWILDNPQRAVHDVNPFFSMMPSWFVFPGIGMATVAAIIASQALISSSFTVISEAMSLNIWPSVKIKYPTDIKGQMYIPSVNYILLALCLLIVLIFQSSMKLEAAYGLAITLSMIMTSLLLFLYFLQTKKPLWYSIPLTLFFLIVEMSFFIANMQKFTHGGFISLIIAGMIFLIMYTWYNGRRIKNKYTTYDAVDGTIRHIEQVSEDQTLPKVATHLVYITRAKNKSQLESKLNYSLFYKRPKRADTYWFVCLIISDEPYEFNYSVKTFIPKKVFRIDIRAGFKLGYHTDKYVHLITNELERIGLVDLSTRDPSLKGTEIKGDFLFVVVDRIFRNLELNPIRRILVSIYDLTKKLASNDVRVLDIDPSFAVQETVPLVIPDHTEEELRGLLQKSKLEAIGKGEKEG